MKKIKIATICSGIGSPEKALTNLGVNFEVSYFCEFDKFAAKSYCAIHGESESKNLGDLTKVEIEKLPTDIDLIVGGTPCQDFSLNGKRNGGMIDSNTRSSLMWNFVEIIRETKPKIVIWENVTGCLTAGKMKLNYNKFINELSNIGYSVTAEILNSNKFGIPQRRHRVFVVAIRRDLNIKFKMPNGYKCGIVLNDIVDQNANKKYFLNNFLSNKYIKQSYSDRLYIFDSTLPGYSVAYNGDSVNLQFPTSKTRGGRVGKQIANTLDTACNQAIVLNGLLRKYSPLEGFRLMGFSDDDFSKCVLAGMSDTQLYKQAGNSIVVNVLMAIFGELYKINWQPIVYGKFWKTEAERLNEIPLLKYANERGEL